MALEDIFEGIATRIVLSTSHKAVVEVCLDQIAPAVRTFKANGYTDVQVIQPALGDAKERWLVEARVWLR